MKRILTTLLLSAAVVIPASGEVFIYRGPNGERMISDRPPSAHDGQYELLTKRDSLQDAGHILAKRRVDRGSIADFRVYIRKASKRYRVDADLVEAVIYVESGFDPEAVSDKGATGLMQLMWATARQYEVTDRFNPRQNIYAGVKHLSELMDRFDGRIPLALAAYNAGADAVERHRGIPPFAETQRFVDKVLSHRRQLKQLYGSVASE